MNKTQKIIIEETIYLGLAIPTEISIILDYLIPTIKDAGLTAVFGSIGNLFLSVFTGILIYASYQWVRDISYNINKTSNLLSKEKFEWFLCKLFLTFITTFIIVLIIKNKIGL